MKNTISTGEVAKMFDVHPDTIRDWTDKGLLKTTKTLGGHRRYHLSDIQEVLDRRDNGTGRMEKD